MAASGRSGRRLRTWFERRADRLDHRPAEPQRRTVRRAARRRQPRAYGHHAGTITISTAALENPEWCERAIARHGDRDQGIAIDVKGSRLAARGWVREGGDWAEAVDRLSAAGCAAFVVTDVNSDGMLTGPNLDLLRRVCERTDAEVIASTGASPNWTTWRRCAAWCRSWGDRRDHRNCALRRAPHP